MIEAVAVYVTIEHPRRGDLRIELERNGVTSLLTDDKFEFARGLCDGARTVAPRRSGDNH